jgi:hypothetical protein
MKKHILPFLIASMFASPLFAQSAAERYAADVSSIGAIIDAYYAVVSGSSQDPWQFARDKHIHLPNALITHLDSQGDTYSHSLEAEYIPMLLSPKQDFYEHELKRDVARFGNMAQVWSAFEIRTDPAIGTDIRGLSSIQLHFASGRWWISSWTTEMESDSNGLLAEFLKESEPK